jgi:hypothetical protein
MDCPSPPFTDMQLCNVHWDGENPNFVNHLQVWGKASTVKLKTNKTPKMADCGVQLFLWDMPLVILETICGIHPLAVSRSVMM